MPSSEPGEGAKPTCRNKSKGINKDEGLRKLEEADKLLLDAVDQDDAEAVAKLLQGGQSPNVGRESGSSAVHLAVMRPLSGVRILQLLIDHGAHVAFEDDYGKTPIQTCIEQSSDEDDEYEMWGSLFSMLLERRDASGALEVDLLRVHPTTKNNLLHIAAWSCSVKLGKRLLDTHLFDEKLDDVNGQGHTVMHIAAIRATKEFVQNLVEAGANPNAAEKNGRRLSKETPLQSASSMGKLETAKYLTDLGTAVDSIKFYTKLKKKKNDPMHGMKKGSPRGSASTGALSPGK